MRNLSVRHFLGSWRNTFVAATLLLLEACGGGGGETPQSTGLQALVLTKQNMADVAKRGPEAGESLLQIGQLAIDILNRARKEGTRLVSAHTCPNGGFINLTLQDKDNNSSVSAGDRLVAELRDCGVATMNAALAGTISLDLTKADITSGDSVVGTLSFDPSGVRITISKGSLAGANFRLLGILGFEWSRSEFETSLRVVSAPSDDFRLVTSGSTKTISEAYRNINVTKSLRFDEARSHIALNFVLDSDLLGGRVSVSSPLALKAYLDTYPEVGQIELRGAGSAVLRIRPHFVTDSEQFDAELDETGKGVYVTTMPYRWLDATRGYLLWSGLYQLSWGEDPYKIDNFRVTNFSYVVGELIQPSVKDTFRLQFTQLPTTMVNLWFRFRDNGSLFVSDDIERENVAATYLQQGASISIRPSTPLRHSRLYSLEVSTNGTVWDGEAIPIAGTLGNKTFLFKQLASFSTAVW